MTDSSNNLRPHQLIALKQISDSIKTALGVAPTSEVLSLLTGCFVSLTKELVRRQKGEEAANQEIVIDGGNNPDITIHAEKGNKP